MCEIKSWTKLLSHQGDLIINIHTGFYRIPGEVRHHPHGDLLQKSGPTSIVH